MEGNPDELIQKSLRVLRNKIARFKKKESELKQVLDFKSTSELKTEFNDLKSIVESLEQGIHALETAQSVLVQKEHSIQSTFKANKEVVSKLNKELKEKDATISALTSESKKLNIELKSQGATLESLKKDASTQLTTISKLERTNKEGNKTIETLKESIRQKSNEIKEKQDVIENYSDQSAKQVSIHQKRLEQTENQLALSKHAFDHEKQLLMTRIQQLNLEQENDAHKWGESIKSHESKQHALQKEIEILIEKNKQLSTESTKFEEELVEYNQSTELVEFVRIVQILDFFDVAKTDSLKIRKFVLNDKQLLHKPKEFNKLGDFHTFDYFCKSIKGSSKSIEENLKNGSIMMTKLLEKSSDEVIYGVSFKKLYDQMNELCLSSIYLNTKPLTPMLHQVEQIQSEETVLSALFRDKKQISPDSPEQGWLNNPLYEKGGMESDEEEKSEKSTKPRGSRGSRRTGGRGRWPRKDKEQ
jgi:myosin heavy subunit